LWQRLAPLTRRVLPATTPLRALAAGLLWGALPCGLVYGAVAIAATAGTPAGGALVMAAFWAGTAPVLIAAGASAARLRQVRGRPLFRRAAGALLVVTGALSLALPLLHSHALAH
jgi:sulfite exporter TauE/SafE